MKEKKELIIFIPSIEDGGVEKNLYLITNYLSTKLDNICLITANTNKKKNSLKKLILFLQIPCSGKIDQEE